MEQKIKSISEAFSMQPCSFVICKKIEDSGIAEIGIKGSKHTHNEFCIKEIKLEYNNVIQDNQYVGYDFKGNKMFEYLQSSVNVNYDTSAQADG